MRYSIKSLILNFHAMECSLAKYFPNREIYGVAAYLIFSMFDKYFVVIWYECNSSTISSRDLGENFSKWGRHSVSFTTHIQSLFSLALFSEHTPFTKLATMILKMHSSTLNTKMRYILNSEKRNTIQKRRVTKASWQPQSHNQPWLFKSFFFFFKYVSLFIGNTHTGKILSVHEGAQHRIIWTHMLGYYANDWAIYCPVHWQLLSFCSSQCA